MEWIKKVEESVYEIGSFKASDTGIVAPSVADASCTSFIGQNLDADSNLSDDSGKFQSNTRDLSHEKTSLQLEAQENVNEGSVETLAGSTNFSKDEQSLSKVTSGSVEKPLTGKVEKSALSPVLEQVEVNTVSGVSSSLKQMALNKENKEFVPSGRRDKKDSRRHKSPNNLSRFSNFVRGTK